MAHACYDLVMPKGVYKRSEEQIARLRQQAQSAGAAGSPSAEARERMSQERTQHGHSKRGQRTRAYSAWHNMLSRCLNPNVPAYKHYGGRGITVCERWREFANFLADMGEPPEGMTIDRIDNDGNYEPGNCRWTTPSEQNANKRSYKLAPEVIAKRSATVTGKPRGPYKRRQP